MKEGRQPDRQKGLVRTWSYSEKQPGLFEVMCIEIAVHGLFAIRKHELCYYNTNILQIEKVMVI